MVAENSDRAEALAVLQAAAAENEEVADKLRSAVAQARRVGISWTDIAAALGLPRSTVFYRFQQVERPH